ncbi:hypothetical protein H6S82_21470 [Planktothrix sp. FACHB-1355]|uniref:Uncharacterized protein n=1 Tax=Aerosakkonema funiforme FACHB-1375 TaxID=2949571 RepID=A0A926VA04_9CYAN|nr:MULTISPECIES: hypothetical protein [Oscillatoriales]MBD2179700.1 hypothetical protein [Aerosakkonema funiforme FACHB-1375]MBD3561389.1 hypothetical protein [Planktothrix sp. FACHB-1355]
MTQTPSNNGNSTRLDRIEAILERTVEDTSELRSALTQLTAQTVADREADERIAIGFGPIHRAGKQLGRENGTIPGGNCV